MESVRAFASERGLRVGGQYTSFVDWPGDRIVTTLVRTRPGSLDAVGWWYPFLGQLPYRGYFDQARAEREAIAESKARIEMLFTVAKADRAKIPALKKELDAQSVFRRYENRFLDLFREKNS